MAAVADELAALNDEFRAIHARKEDLFWATKMGLCADPDAGRRDMAEAEKEWNRFVSEPKRLSRLRALESSCRTDSERKTLAGWIAMLQVHLVEDPAARRLSEEIVEREAELQGARGSMNLGYTDPDSGAFVPASSVKLGLMLRTDADERRRKAAFQGMAAIEPYVIEHGFLEIVKLRNRLARTLGHVDYYAWKISQAERLTKSELFGVLDDLERRTGERAMNNLRAFSAKHGDGALDPWNLGFLRSGNVTQALDPYFSFREALARWGRSFAALGVRYRGAQLTLDLVDRQGKYENGFMHGPGLVFSDAQGFHPARINFTANAVPGQVGSGHRALETLFHEGGHAAHFSNIQAEAVCFSHEFAPTSIAYAETQSMFLDSLVADPDWRVLYARDKDGREMPRDLLDRSVLEGQPFRGWDVRAMLTVPFGERFLYELPDDQLNAEVVLPGFRAIERRLQGLTAGARPILAVPHLLAGESSAYYHAYVLAEVAVHQTRAFFLARDGQLTDNPRIGPELEKHYWSPGNAVPFQETLRSLTGGSLSADALVARCNQDTDEALAESRNRAEAARRRGPVSAPVSLDGVVRVVHGPTVVAEATLGAPGAGRSDADDREFQKACDAFATWIDQLEKDAGAKKT